MSSLTACQKTATQKYTPNQTESLIIGGEQVPHESILASRVIYLALDVVKKTTPFGVTLSQKGICTASAITSRILITAGHCVHKRTKDQVYAVLSTNPWNHALKLDEWIAVEQIKVHPDFSGSNGDLNDDIALLKLSQDLPPERISKLADLSQVLSETFSITAIGYGKTSALNALKNKPSPEENGNDLNRLGHQSTMLYSVPKVVEKYDVTAKTFSVDQSDMKGICEGDSGGPGLLFDQEKEDHYILGLATFVSVNQKEDQLRDPRDLYNLCVGRGHYTNVLVYKDWINSTVLELN